MNKKTLVYIIYTLAVLFSITFANAAVWNGQEYETKNQPPSEIIDTVRKIIIEKGISEDYFDEHFSLKTANINSWSAEKGWESASISWEFKINDEYTVAYRTNVYKINEGFSVTENYVIKDGVAYSFDTKKLHEFGRLVSRLEAQEKLKECLGFKPDVETPSLHPDGNLFLSASKPFILQGSVNLETGELNCSEVSLLESGTEPTAKEPKQISLNLIYWIIGAVAVIILIIILFLKLRKK